ncbi:MAG: serine/threonine-protein kinase [Phycisphaerae bacterium]|jgi:serine/threonine protein kinase
MKDPRFQSSDDDRLIDAALAQERSDRNGSSASFAQLTKSVSVRPRTPVTIGGYRVVRKLGEGGMGVVYEAEQQQPRRAVALKVVRGGPFVDEYSIQLFRREAQALARLKDPCIASIYEAGQTGEGQHYFAMELVRGVPLRKFVRERKLTVRERLALFNRICKAIHYAHQRGVIHRDLKPSNILISANRTPKILDFGLAKIIDTDLGLSTLDSGVGKIQGSLPYMAPEQALGHSDEVDLRTDVYALGAILYEVVTGHLPIGVCSSSLPGSVKAICEDIPLRPSAISKELRGELETIILKALEKEPERRYQSALALAEDIERYLTNQPILARPASAAYHVRKLIARHKLVFAVSSSAVAAVFVILVTSTVLYAGLADRATKAEQRTEAVRDSLQEILRAILPVKDAGERARIISTLDSTSTNAGTWYADDPLLLASMRLELAEAYLSLAEYELALPHAQSAVELRTAEFGEEDPDTLDAMNTLAKILRYLGRYEEAEPLSASTLDARRRILGDEHVDTLESMNDYAVLLRNSDDVEAAVALHREALAIKRRVLGPDDPRTAMSMTNLAAALTQQHMLPEAEALAREALDNYRRIYGETHQDTVHAIYILVRTVRLRGDHAETVRLYSRAIDLARDPRVFGEGHPHVANLLYGLGTYHVDTGNYAAAEPLLRGASQIRIDRLSLGDRRIGTTRRDFGLCLTKLGKYEEAEEELLAAFDNLKAANHTSALAVTVNGLIELYENLNRPDEAERWRAELEALLAPPAQVPP